MIFQHQLPKLEQDNYYWADLIGLEVYNLEDKHLGQIIELFETGANDVMVIRNEKSQKEILIPYVPLHVIKKIDGEKKTMIVEWQPEWL